MASMENGQWTVAQFRARAPLSVLINLCFTHLASLPQKQAAETKENTSAPIEIRKLMKEINKCGITIRILIIFVIFVS